MLVKQMIAGSRLEEMLLLAASVVNSDLYYVWYSDQFSISTDPLTIVINREQGNILSSDQATLTLVELLVCLKCEGYDIFPFLDETYPDDILFTTLSDFREFVTRSIYRMSERYCVFFSDDVDNFFIFTEVKQIYDHEQSGPLVLVNTKDIESIDNPSDLMWVFVNFVQAAKKHLPDFKLQ